MQRNYFWSPISVTQLLSIEVPLFSPQKDGSMDSFRIFELLWNLRCCTLFSFNFSPVYVFYKSCLPSFAICISTTRFPSARFFFWTLLSYQCCGRSRIFLFLFIHGVGVREDIRGYSFRLLVLFFFFFFWEMGVSFGLNHENINFSHIIFIDRNMLILYILL